MIYLFLAALCSATLTLVLKLFRNPKGNRFGIILGNYLTCVLIAFLQMPEKGNLFSVSSSTLLMSTVAGFLYVAGLVLIQTSVKVNGATMTSAFSKLSLIVPLAVSFLFFNEIPSLLKIGGLLLAACAILLINSSSGKKAAGEEKKNLTLLLLTLLAVGCSDSMTKIFSRLGNQSEDTRYFFFLFSTAALLTLVLAAVEKKKTGKGFRLTELASGILAGIPNYFASYLLLQSVLELPASLVYPCYSVGAILLVTLGSAVFFREKLGKRQYIGLAVILCALVLLNL